MRSVPPSSIATPERSRRRNASTSSRVRTRSITSRLSSAWRSSTQRRSCQLRTGSSSTATTRSPSRTPAAWAIAGVSDSVTRGLSSSVPATKSPQ